MVVKRLIGMRASLLAAVLLLVSGCGDGSDAAGFPNIIEDMPSVEELVAEFVISEAELQDLQWIADEEGWTLQEAILRIQWSGLMLMSPSRRQCSRIWRCGQHALQPVPHRAARPFRETPAQ